MRGRLGYLCLVLLQSPLVTVPGGGDMAALACLLLLGEQLALWIVKIYWES